MSNDQDRPPQPTSAIDQMPPEGARGERSRGRATSPDAHHGEPLEDRHTSSKSATRDETSAKDDAPIRRASTVRPATSRTRAWLILPIGVAGVVVAVVIGLFIQSEQPQTVSEVMHQVSETVLRTSDRPGVEDGGPLGPLWIAARQADIKSGELTDVRLRAGHVRVSAATGRVIIDPKDNTISFALENVVLLRVPDAGSGVDANQSLLELDSFVIGPLNYKRRIVPDGSPVYGRRMQDRLAGVPVE